MNSKISKNKKFKDSVTNFPSNALSFIIYPPRKIKYNLLQEKKIQNMLDKVKFIAKNMIYIRNFSKKNFKKQINQSVSKGSSHNGSNVLFRNKNLEL